MASEGKQPTDGKSGENVTNGEREKNLTESSGRFPFDQKIPV